jgi:rhamnulokinase
MSQKATTNFLAIDLGASNGRVLNARWDGERFELEELHRFPNGPVRVAGRLYTDALRLWTEIGAGLAAYTARYKAPATAISVDTWGVDYGLLDRAGNLLGNPYHYRDSRTNGIPQKLYERVPADEVYRQTGLQTMPFNTIFQLYSMVVEAHPQLQAADKLLMLPDLFNYWLTGETAGEYTIASTSQMLLCREREWARGLLGQLRIPTHILPRLVAPGTVLGCLRTEIASEAGFAQPVAVVAGASHDTASAVAAVPALDEKSAYISSGTWNLVGMELAEPVITKQALEMNFTNEGGVANTIRFLRNIPGLWLLQESRRQWQSEGRDYGWDELLAEAGKAPAFRSLVVPEAPAFLAPGDMPAAIREFCRRTGQPLPESVGQVVRCCLESIALRSRWAMDVLENLTGRKIETVRIVGGGCRNRLLCQFTADACGRAVVAGPVEAAALGCVMMQAIATGHLEDISAGRRAIAASFPQESYEPRETDAWTAAYGRFERLVKGSELVH